MIRNCLFSCLLLVFLSSCRKKDADYRITVNKADFLHRSVGKLTDVIVYDIFSPPVASRIYVYPNVAAYEILIQQHPQQYQSLTGQLRGFEGIPKPQAGQEYCLPLASTHAFLMVSKSLIFSEEKIAAFEEELHKEFAEAGVPDDVYERSVSYGDEVAKAVLAWAAKDNYKQTRGFERYTVTNSPGTWVPTPPDYMDAVEPHWNKIRPFVLDSCSQFAPPAPPTFSTEKSSQFYQDALEVYQTGKHLTDEQLAIAKFWDCNPFVVQHTGHLMFGNKKITPGGHWMSIASIANRKANASLVQSAETYTRVALALADGFISCWDEKYRSKVIRPETVINQQIDEAWAPLLTTPPFPEYPSGHSVISAAAAVTLTHLFGDSFSYVDSTEVRFGLPPRSFSSFTEAANEAAISRLYGGIHYRPAIENGVEQGKKVGQFQVQRLTTRKAAIANKNQAPALAATPVK